MQKAELVLQWEGFYRTGFNSKYSWKTAEMEIIKLHKEEQRTVGRKGKPIVSEGLGTGAGGDVKMGINSKGGKENS